MSNQMLIYGWCRDDSYDEFVYIADITICKYFFMNEISVQCISYVKTQRRVNIYEENFFNCLKSLPIFYLFISYFNS